YFRHSFAFLSDEAVLRLTAGGRARALERFEIAQLAKPTAADFELWREAEFGILAPALDGLVGFAVTRRLLRARQKLLVLTTSHDNALLDMQGVYIDHTMLLPL